MYLQFHLYTFTKSPSIHWFRYDLNHQHSIDDENQWHFQFRQNKDKWEKWKKWKWYYCGICHNFNQKQNKKLCPYQYNIWSLACLCELDICFCFGFRFCLSSTSAHSLSIRYFYHALKQIPILRTVCNTSGHANVLYVLPWISIEICMYCVYIRVIVGVYAFERDNTTFFSTFAWYFFHFIFRNSHFLSIPSLLHVRKTVVWSQWARSAVLFVYCGAEHSTTIKCTM